MHSYIEKVYAFVVTFVVASAFSLSATAASVGTAEEFVASVAGDPTGTHTLTADITLSGWTPCAFSGSLDGAGHKLTGLTGALFSNLSGTVKNLTLQGDSTENTIAADEDFGVLAVVASGATISGCTVSGFKLINQQETTTTRPGLGFFVGRAYDGCSFSECATDSSCSVVVGVNVYCGGIVGRVDRSADFSAVQLATFSGCVNNANCSSSVGNSGTTVAGNGAFGGILGIFANTGSAVSTVTLSSCKNFGGLSLSADDVSINHAFGGIVGRYEGKSATTDDNLLEILGCENNGSYIKTSGSSTGTAAGGLIGYCGTYAARLLIDRCVNNGNFHAILPSGTASTTGVCLGGFVGGLITPSKNHETKIVNSVQRGTISMTGSTTSSGAAGAFGYIKFVSTVNGAGTSIEVANCSFEGVITADVDARAMIAVAGAKSRSGTVFNVKNCWVSEDATRLLNYETNVPDYSESDLQIHVSGADAAECAALNTVASGVDEYLAWTVNVTTTHPEPAIPLVVRFVDWDGTLLKQQLVESGGAATAPAVPARIGYTFNGWDPDDFSNVTADMTIRAYYTCSVLFKNWDGTEFQTVTVREGTAVAKPQSCPVKQNCTFQYWALNDEEYDFSAPVSAQITLMAVFAVNTYPVVFLDWSDTQIGEVQNVPHGSAAIAPTLPPIPVGMTFKRWDRDFSNVTEPLTVKAIMGSSFNAVWVSEDGLDAGGRGTAAAPFATVAYAVRALDFEDGGTVYIKPGLYSQSTQTLIEAPIHILGATGNPADVVFTNEQVSATAQGDRFFRVAHARALIANLTMVDGSGSADGTGHNGGAFVIREAGGTVSNCVIRHGRSLQGSSRGAGAYLYNGLVTHCVFTGSFSTSPDGNSDPSAEGVVIHCNGTNARVENTLIYDVVPTAVIDGPSQGPIVAVIKGLMRNCTVVPRIQLSATTSTDGKYKKWNDDGGCAVRCGSGGRVENCAVAGLKSINGELKPFGGTLANFYSCIGDGDMDLSAMHDCRHATEEEMFLDPAAKDYRPRTLGALVNCAREVPEYRNLVDLAGMKRIVKLLDIGCYESQFVPGLVITGKRID